jgi:hypothetical protein
VVDHYNHGCQECGYRYCQCRQTVPEAPPTRVEKPVARKDDNGKPRIGLIPPTALMLIAEVFTFGSKKYSDWNWTKGLDWSRMYDAGQRHLMAWQEGEDNDSETNKSHLAHACCCLIMLMVSQHFNLGKDDRPTYARKEVK